MSFVDTGKLVVVERKPEWFGRYFHSPNMTFAHYQIVGAGMAAIVLPNVPYSITALTDGKAIVVDYPFRGDPVGKEVRLKPDATRDRLKPDATPDVVMSAFRRTSFSRLFENGQQLCRPGPPRTSRFGGTSVKVRINFRKEM